nr:Arm DNA-binding domain-containing protein [Kitasatospora aureofaciens]
MVVAGNDPAVLHDPHLDVVLATVLRVLGDAGATALRDLASQIVYVLGAWSWSVDLAPEDGRRRTRRRGGFASRAEAAKEMARVLDAEYRGVYEERNLRVDAFLHEWLEAKRPALAPNTWAG